MARLEGVAKAGHYPTPPSVAEPYGVEIARDRADEAQAALDHMICGSAFAVRLA